MYCWLSYIFPPNKINFIYQKPFYSHSKPEMIHGGLNLEIPLAFWQRTFPCSSTAAHKSLARLVQAFVWTIPSSKLPGDTDAWWHSALEIRASMDVDTKIHTPCAQSGGGKSSAPQSEGANEQAGETHHRSVCWRGGEQHLGLVAGVEMGSFVPQDCSVQGMSYTGRITQLLLETEPWWSLPAQSCCVFWDKLYFVEYIRNISNLMCEPHCPG